jgi:hypothetical protein
MNCCGTLQKNGKNCTRESKSCPYHRRRNSSSGSSSKRNVSKRKSSKSVSSVKSRKYSSRSSSPISRTKSRSLSKRKTSKSPKKVSNIKVKESVQKVKVFKFKNYGDYKLNREKIIKIDFDLDKFLETSEINPDNRTAIIVPYRDTPNKERSVQMKIFLEHYYNFLPNVKIYIIEQSDFKKKFNRGKLLNIGFKIAKRDKAQVFITHDIDLISPKEMAPLYNLIPDHPVHIGGLWKEKYTFSTFFGGIVSYNSEDYEKTNGFPNKFEGHGGEDDSQYNRLVINSIPIYVPYSETLKIKGLEHESMSDNPETKNTNKQKNILNDFQTWRKNGVNNVKYKLLKVKKTLYKNAKIYSVDIN